MQKVSEMSFILRILRRRERGISKKVSKHSYIWLSKKEGNDKPDPPFKTNHINQPIYFAV